MPDYIVVFKDSAKEADIKEYIVHITTEGGKIKYHYDALINGVAASMSESLAQSFRQDNDIVDFIEPDGVATTQGEGGFGI